MSAMAVSPIATPIKARRRSGLAIAWYSGAPGCSSSITQIPATTMNTPSPAASIRYSCQCWRSDARAASISAPRREFGVERHAPVDKQGNAVDVVAGVGGKPDGGTGDVFGLADALVGHQPHQRLIGLRRRPRVGVDRRPGGAGRQPVHADPA